MRLLVKLAFKNLREHWIKTAILGIIIFNSVWILLVSNSFLGMAQSGIKNAFINMFTGDVIIKENSPYSYSLFGVQAPGGIEDNPQIQDFEKVRDLILNESSEEIEAFTFMASGGVFISFEEQKNQFFKGIGFLFGIDGDSYFDMFSQIKIVEGRFLKSNENGIMISVANQKELREVLGHSVNIGDLVKLTGLSNVGPKIREVPLVGTYQLGEVENDINYLCYTDIQTLRALKGMNLSNSEVFELNKKEEEVFEKLDDSSVLDNLFSSDSMIVEEADSTRFDEDSFFAFFEGDANKKAKKKETFLTEQEKKWIEKYHFASSGSIFKDKGPREFILIKLKEQASIFGRFRQKQYIRKLNSIFKKEGIFLKVGNWKDAAGPFAGMADLVVKLYFIVIIMVIIVAFFIVINTLVLSVVQRKYEIGTMRALGAQRGFIAALFTFEILFTSFIFTVLGVIFSIAILFILGLFEIEATNSFFSVIFNGAVLKPVITFSQVIITTIIVFVIGLLSNLVPLVMAMKIQPVEAMRG